MKKLKSNRLSHLAYGEVFPTEKQKKAQEDYTSKRKEGSKMHYSAVGESGKDYIIKIKRQAVYATMIIICDGTELYKNDYLPALKTQIDCEENCNRIAKQYIK